MKKLLFTPFFITLVYIATASLNFQATRVNIREESKHADSAYLDCMALPLDRIPDASDLYKAAKISIGRWAKLFVVIKIQESGADGKNSGLARKYNNLTGMRYPGKRETFAIGKTKSNYSIFKNWYESMLDFGLYAEYAENSFRKKHNRDPKDEYEMINHMYGSFNPYSTWKRDVFRLLKNFKYDKP